MPVPKSKVTEITIPAPDIQSMIVELKGVTPLIFHKWSEKAKKMILDKQLKKATKGREIRNPEEEFVSSFYTDKEGYISFPALSIKQSLIGATRSLDGLPMTLLRATVFPLGDENDMVRLLVDDKPIKLSGEVKMFEEGEMEDSKIIGCDSKNPNIEMRSDMVRVGMGTADLRFRGQIKRWTMKVLVKWNNGKLSAEQILNLFQYSGFSTGLGEWRPEKDGNSGTFTVATSK